MADLQLEGWAELKPRLLDLPDKMVNRILHASMRQGANVMKDEAKQLAVAGGDYPDAISGAMRDSIRTYKARGTRDKVQYMVIAGNEAAYYAGWVEYGHGGPHPAPPHPFMRPAAEATGQLALDFVMTGISDRLESLVE